MAISASVTTVPATQPVPLPDAKATAAHTIATTKRAMRSAGLA